MKIVSEHTDQFYLTTQFQKFYEKSANSLIIKANPPNFTVLAVSNQFLELTKLKRAEVLGQDLFKVFPGSQQDSSKMQASIKTFKKAIETKKGISGPDFSCEVTNEMTGKMELQYWSNYHEPILNEVVKLFIY